MSSTLTGALAARQVSPLRRIGLPKRLAGPSGISPLGYVVLTRPRNARLTLMVRASEGGDGGGLRDPGRPRRVSKTWQVTLPAKLMDGVGLSVWDWVYVARSPNGRSLRLLPAASMRFAEVDGDYADPGTMPASGASKDVGVPPPSRPSANVTGART